MTSKAGPQLKGTAAFTLEEVSHSGNEAETPTRWQAEEATVHFYGGLLNDTPSIESIQRAMTDD